MDSPRPIPTVRRAGLLKILCVALLLAPLFLPHGLAVLGISEGPAARENRRKTPLPPISLAATDFKAFAAQLTKAYPDTFPFRDWMIRSGNILSIALFRESPSKDVILGQDGWLFYNMEMDLEDWLGVDLYSPEELAQAKRVLSARRDWLAKHGIAFLVVIAPNKSTLYGRFLPGSFHRLEAASRLDQLAKAMREADIPFLDLRPALTRASQEHRTYQKTDSHWDGWGAFAGAQAIVQALRGRFPAMAPLDPANYQLALETRPGGDLAGMLLLSDAIPERFITMEPLAPNRAKPALPRGYANPATLSGRDLVIRETGDATLPNAVIFRDSFSTLLWPFLAERFNRSVFIWEHRFQPDIVLAEKPDVVIYEAVERYQYALFGFSVELP